MKKSKIVQPFISLLLTFTILLVSMPIMSIDVGAAACKCTNPSPSSRTIAPTCTAQGYKETYCKKCNGSLSKSNYTAARGHSMQTTKNATCSTAGTKKCSRCSYTQSIPATGNHSPSTRTKTAATCTAAGAKETYCTSCGKVLSTSTIAALGHSMQVTKNATCGAAGTKKCSRCSYTQSIAATGNHSPATRTKTAATCTAAGTKETYCTVCSKVLSTSTIAALGHSMQITKNATCAVAGTKKCSRCTHTESIPVLGHSLEITKNATCGVAGTKTCKRAGCTYTESIAATGNHSPATRTKTAATCTADGVKETYCTVCNNVLSTGKIDKLGHSLEVTKNPTCGATGTNTCKRAGCTYTASIPATGNHNPATRTKTAATCTADGVKETYCTVCNNVLSTGKIDKLGHSLEVTKNPTCGATGTNTCKRAGCTYTASIPATGNHNPATRTKTAATCTADGVKETYCTICNNVLSIGKIDKLGHSLEVTKNPTCGAAGTNICKRAGCTYTASIPATGNHSPLTRITQLPTCTAKGKKETYCKLCNEVLSTALIDKYEHSLIITKTATCGTEGSKECKRAGCTYTEVIPITNNHNPSTRTKTPSTCTEKGIKETYCKLCNQVLSVNSIPALDHKFEITLNPSCGDEGIKECKRAGCTQTKNIPATENHNPTRRTIKSATCTADGIYEVYCTRCNNVLTVGKIEASHNFVYTQVNKDVHCKSCKRCKESEQENHNFEAGTCIDCKYFSAKDCDHPQDKRIRKTIAPTCMKDLTIEFWCEACNKRLESKVIYGIKGEHSLKWDVCDTKAYSCGAKHMQATCTEPGCKYSYVSEKIVHPANSNPKGARRIVKNATCTTDGTCEVYCTVCNVILSTGTIPAHHTADESTVNLPNFDWAVYEHQVMCKDCKNWFRVPHNYKYVSNYDGTHDYKCICGNIEKTEDCYLKESTEIKDNGYTKEIITTYSCTFCDYSTEKTVYNHYKHNANITIACDFEYGGRRQHCVYCDDEHCEASYAAHVFACKDPERPADSIECVMCGIDLIAAEANYDNLPYVAGGTDPFGGTNAYYFAPDDPESRLDAWDQMTEFDPDEEDVFFYLTNGKESYIIWNSKVAVKIDYFTVEELKKAIEKKYSLNNIIVIQT